MAELFGSESGVGEAALLDEVLSELEDDLRNLGGPLSSVLLEELDELLDELEVLSPELDVALRSFGRSGSSSLLEELLEELFDEAVSELELARRSLGRSPEVGVSAELPDELLAELVEEGLVMGRVGSSVACDAVACSSSVPSFTIAMVWAL